MSTPEPNPESKALKRTHSERLSSSPVRNDAVVKGDAEQEGEASTVLGPAHRGEKVEDFEEDDEDEFADGMVGESDDDEDGLNGFGGGDDIEHQSEKMSPVSGDVSDTASEKARREERVMQQLALLEQLRGIDGSQTSVGAVGQDYQAQSAESNADTFDPPSTSPDRSDQSDHEALFFSSFNEAASYERPRTTLVPVPADDVDEVSQDAGTYVRRIVKAFDAEYKTEPEGRDNPKIHMWTEEERKTQFKKWQKDGKRQMENILKDAAAPKFREHMAWRIVEEAILIHKSGYLAHKFAGRGVVDQGITCSQRLEKIISTIKDLTRVRATIMARVPADVEYIAACPIDFRKSKITNCWDNRVKAKRLGEAKGENDKKSKEPVKKSDRSTSAPTGQSARPSTDGKNVITTGGAAMSSTMNVASAPTDETAAPADQAPTAPKFGIEDRKPRQSSTSTTSNTQPSQERRQPTQEQQTPSSRKMGRKWFNSTLDQYSQQAATDQQKQAQDPSSANRSGTQSSGAAKTAEQASQRKTGRMRRVGADDEAGSGLRRSQRDSLQDEDQEESGEGDVPEDESKGEDG